MAKNVLSLQLLRNSTVFPSKADAITGINNGTTQDGVIKLARYTEGAATKTIFGIYNDGTGGMTAGYTIYDSYQEAIAAMQDQINAISAATSGTSITLKDVENMLGSGVTTGNSVTQQLQALSGDSATAQSGDTSVAGAKKYTDDKIATLDYTGVTTSDAVVITNVTEADGVVAATTANVGNLKLTDYSQGTASGDVVATDTINEAFGKIENQIANLESGSSEEIEEIKNSLGSGVTTANTATAQFAALSGDASTAQSGDTSVEGAKKYADGKVAEIVDGLDYTDTAVSGSYVSKVDEVNGVISVTRAALPTVNDTAVAKKFVTEVDQTNGEISVSRGEITSTDKTITLTDGNDGGIDFAVNIDNSTIVKDANGVLSVANSALIEYVGDDRTINVSAADANNKKTISTLLTLSAVTPSSTTVKEEYALVDASGTTKGETIKIYKDSSLVSITYITDPADTHYQNLEYVYVDASGNTQTEYVDMSALVLEAEFASGVTVGDGHVVHGVVDSTSETFLTVGADGFKLSGVQTAIDNAVSGATAQTAALSAKTVTEITSSNSSISATTSTAADGTVSVDLVTDASKVKMTGFTADASGFSAITTASTVTEAVKAIETEFLANEQTTAAALNDLEDTKLENIVVNGVTGTVANQTATVTIGGGDVLLTGYASGATGEVAATDNVDAAISKLNTKIAAAVAGGVNTVTADSGITVNNTDTNNPVVGAKLTVAADLPQDIAENAIKFDSTNNGMYVEYIDAGTY